MLHASRGIAALAEGMGETAFNGAEPHAHIGTGFRLERRRAGVLIRQCIKNHFRKFIFQGIGNGVDEPQERPGGRTFLPVNGKAFLTLTVGAVVQLGDGDDPAIRFCQQCFTHIFNGDLQYFRIRETTLVDMGIFRQKPFAVDQREIFRVTFRIKFLGNQRLQRVDKQRIFHGRPEFFRHIAGPVDAGFDCKASVPAQVIGVVQTVFQDRFLCFGKFRQHKVFTDGDLLIQRREEPAAQFFQKLIDPVDHTPDSAGDVQPGV